MPAIETNLTDGSVSQKLIRYALPLMASSLHQAVYSITDIIIAGHFIGESGISAINTSSVIMNMLTQIAIGLTVGGNILVGQYYGAGNQDQRKQASGNMLTVGLIAGPLMMAVVLEYVMGVYGLGIYGVYIACGVVVASSVPVGQWFYRSKRWMNLNGAR